MLLGRTENIKTKYFSLGKIVFEQLLVIHCHIVYWTPLASLTVEKITILELRKERYR